MASREDEKRRRREERLAQEQAAGKAAARQRVMRTAGRVLLPLGLLAAVIVAVTAGGGKGGGAVSSDGAAAPVPIPKPANANLRAAADAAGCQLRNFPSFGQTHTTDKVIYKSNPPTSGPHDPVPAPDGSYSVGNPPTIWNSVHSLEHGRIEIQFQAGLSKREIGQLQTLTDEQGAYHVLLFANQTRMPFRVAASAWQHYIGCRRFSSSVFDALRDFRKTYTDKAPEQIP